MNCQRLISFCLCSFIFVSQIHAESGAIDFLRSTGKIYSVVAVILIILLGIAYYLFRLDRQISKLEKHIYNEKEK